MEELNANDLVLFAKAVEAGSFSQLAERMGVPKSTVSRRIATLEKSFGERLFHRSTRKLSLTDFGLAMLDYAKTLATDLESAKSLALFRQAKPSGRLRVSLVGDIARLAMSDMIAKFVSEHPSICLEIDASSRRVDLIAENYDLALRLGPLEDNSGLAARKLADLRAGLYASPKYLKAVGVPKVPDDLLNLHGLLFKVPGADAQPWVLNKRSGPDAEHWQGIPRSYTVANSALLLMGIAESGEGVVALPHLFARYAVQSGTLEPVLPLWERPTTMFSAVFPGRRLMPTRTRAFLDALVEAFSDVPEPTAATRVTSERQGRVALAAEQRVS